MSVAGIGSSNFFSSYVPQSTESPRKQIQTEFQQLGQDLQSGNLAQAQQDFSALSQTLQAANPNASFAATTAATTNASATSATTAGTISQDFSQLGQDLQSGNLASAQQDFTTLQSSLQQAQSTASTSGHHHHFHPQQSQNSASSSSSSSSTSSPISQIVQAFSSLAQTLGAGNLSGAQSAYSSLQADLQQIDGFSNAGSNGVAGAASVAASTAASTLNVTA